MIHPSIKWLLVPVVLLVAPGIFASGDCDDPFGGSNCQSQDLDSDDPPGDACGGPITVTSASSSGSTLIVSLANPSESAAQGYLITTVLLAGKEYVNVFAVSMTAESNKNVLVVFPRIFTPIGAYTCSNKPGGINEGPDVVGLIHEEEEE